VYYILFESSCGYALFERTEGEEIGELTPKMQKAFQDFKRFSQVVQFKTFRAYTSPDSGLENINDISEGTLNQFLKEFLQANMPAKGSHTLGVIDNNLAASIESELGITTDRGVHVGELCRVIRLHFETYLSSAHPDVFKSSYLFTTHRGLGHAYSRAKIKHNVNKADNMIIQSICLLDQLDKDVNTLCMRIKEWYSWHFPELGRIVKDNVLFARVAYLIKNKANFDESKVPEIAEILNDPDLAQAVFQARKSSTGYDISDFDIQCIENFASRVIALVKYRSELSDYLVKKMNDIAPNLSSLIGEIVGARLINKAGSLITLAKYPASTIQILGAEKALFRALKSRKGNTPKYGLIFNSSFIGRAKNKDKGRISRYLANKCAIASMLDAFYDYSTHAFGEILKEQVEQRLNYFDTGTTPEKNSDVIKKAIEKAVKDLPEGMQIGDILEGNGQPTKKTKIKRKRVEEDMEFEEGGDEEEKELPTKKTKKTKKKN